LTWEPGIAEGNNPAGLAWKEAVVEIARENLGKEPLARAVAYWAYCTFAVEEQSWRGTGAPSAGRELALLEKRSWCP
jgi:hypothetical protein